MRLNGFSLESAERQVELERRLLGAPNALRIRDHYAALNATEGVHRDGPAKGAAEYLVRQLESFGYDSVLTLPARLPTVPAAASVHAAAEPGVSAVIALLLGEERPEQWVMAGGHRDALGPNDVNPLRGAASLLEAARLIGREARRGYRPRRTIAIASWLTVERDTVDADVWIEQIARELPGDVVLYLHRDGYRQGDFIAGGSWSLQPLVNDVARRVDSPSRSESVYDRWKAAATVTGTEPVAVLVDHGGWTDVRLTEPGPTKRSGRIGMDAILFRALGVPTLRMGFDSEAADDARDMESPEGDMFDPGFETGERLADLTTLLLTRVANAEVPPLDHTATAEAVARRLDELEAEANERGMRLNLRQLREANRSLALNAAALNASIDGLLEGTEAERALQADLIDQLAQLVYAVERDFLADSVSADRESNGEWGRHPLYGWNEGPPGPGYGLSGIRTAIAMNDATLARARATELHTRLERVVERFRAALEESRVEGASLPARP